MTAKLWLESAKEKINSGMVFDYRFNNIGKLADAIKFINEAIVLIESKENE